MPFHILQITGFTPGWVWIRTLCGPRFCGRNHPTIVVVNQQPAPPRKSSPAACHAQTFEQILNLSLQPPPNLPCTFQPARLSLINQSCFFSSMLWHIVLTCTKNIYLFLLPIDLFFTPSDLMKFSLKHKHKITCRSFRPLSVAIISYCVT